MKRKPPKLLLARSVVYTCAYCGGWKGRYPIFADEPTKGGDPCNRCGEINEKSREGRPYGPRSKDWDWIESLFKKYWRYISRYELDLIKTNPSMWTVYRAQYRVVKHRPKYALMMPTIRAGNAR